MRVSPSADAYAAEPEASFCRGAPARTGQAGSSTTQSIQSASQVGGEWITIFSDDFEGAFPGEWHVFDGDGDTHGEYFWGKRDCRPYTGGHSAWAVGGGADGSALACGSHYPDNAYSVMIYGPFSLEDATEAELRFVYWLNSERENDHLFVGASIGGSFYGWIFSDTRDWTLHTFDLTDVYTLGDLTGENQVWVAIAFTSDESTNLPEGAYVDEVVLRKYVEGPTIYLPLAVKNFPVTPEAPVLNAIINPDGVGSYTVSWSSSVGANTYTLQEAIKADFSDATTAYSGSNTSAGISGRDVGTYYYRVRASNPYASSDWSNVESVEVTVPLPECPQTGGWLGVTSQGQFIRFLVEDEPQCQIAAGSLKITVSDPPVGCPPEWKVFMNSFNIRYHSFYTGFPDGRVQGHFTSPTAADGTFDMAWTYFYWIDGWRYYRDCSASGTWTAKSETEIGPNGSVSAVVVQPDGKIVVAGDFTNLKEPRERIARLNPDGSLDQTFDPGADAYVNVLALQPDGKILVGGAFTTLGGQPRNRIARVNPDGSLDATFNPGADDRVSALAVQADGKILMGGGFSEVNGQPRRRIARLNQDGSLDTAFNPGVEPWAGVEHDYVSALALQADGRILVGGQSWTKLGGEPRHNIGRLHPDGSVDLEFDPASPSSPTHIRAIAVDSDGKILVGGRFSSLGGVSRHNIARLNEDGTVDTGFDPGVGGMYVRVLEVQSDGKILVGGSFYELDGEARNNIGRLNADGTLDAAFSPSASNYSYSPSAGIEVRTLVVQVDEKIVVGGRFPTLCGELRPYLGRLNADGTLDTSFP